MVFFTCNACGESMKKAQVEKHYTQQCRRCEVLSCVDCGKDFWGDEYQKHTKCISEEEKYSGKNYKPKASANKGEQKQELWTQQVQSAIDKAPSNPKLKGLLEKLKDYPNIPRKKAKFENFLKNSLKLWDPKLLSQIWDLVNAEISQKPAAENSKDEGTSTSSIHKGSQKSKQEEQATGDVKETSTETSEGSSGESRDKKLSKRERKEERRKLKHKGEKKDGRLQASSAETDEKANRKKSKKRKLDESLEEPIEQNGTEERNVQPKKKKKKKAEKEGLDSSQDTDIGIEPNHNVSLESTQESQQAEKGKFKWGQTIIMALQQSSDGELSLKKLKKKVLNEYAAHTGDASDPRLLAKFDKKVKSQPGVKVHKERAKLLPS